MATADRQLASRSYDAAIDTYRTALGEPGAAEAGVEARLEAACRIRDEARGIVRPVEPSAPPAPEPPKTEVAELPSEPLVEQRVELKLAPELALKTAPEPALKLTPQPAPARLAAVNRPIEPPSFHMEGDPPLLESYDHEGSGMLEVERLSILDPRPLPEEHAPARSMAVDDRPVEPPSFHLIEDDPSILEKPRRDRYAELDVRSLLDPAPDPVRTATRLLIAMVIAVAVVVVAYYAK
jgi:hypothetical protein